MPTDCLSKQIFTYRLNLLKTRQWIRQKGFISDTFNLLQTHGLIAYLQSYLAIANFPDFFPLKMILFRVVERKSECERQERMNLNHDFDSFVSVHKNSVTSLFWICAKPRNIYHASCAIKNIF